MSNEEAHEQTHGTSGVHYEIHIKGHLDARWTAWFEGMDLSRGLDGTTIIQGPVADQSALHGLLQRVRDLGLELVSVTPVKAQ